MKRKTKDAIEDKKPWVSEVTRDAVKHFVWGIGDNNPMWERAVPPSFAYAINETTVAPDHEEYERHYASVEWEWFQPFTIGECIHIEQTSKDEKSEQETDTFYQTGKTKFLDSQKTVIAQSTVNCRRDKLPLLEPANRPEIRYTAEELNTIEKNILAEQWQETNQLFWEDVRIGELVGSIRKGPLSIMDIVAWCSGTLGSPENTQKLSLGGLQDQAATGPQVVAWLIHLITNWIGDKGTLLRLRAELKQHPFLGSTTTLSGVVTDLGIKEKSHWCEINIKGQLQNGELTIQGKAVVQLPSKAEK